jgi:hypothetical protein
MYRRRHPHRSTRGADAHCPPRTPPVVSRGVRARSPRRGPPGATRARRRRRGLPCSCARQAPLATTPGKAPPSRPRAQLEGASTALHTRPHAERTRETGSSSRGGSRQGPHRLAVGHRPRGPRAPLACPHRPGVAQQRRPAAAARPQDGATCDGVTTPAGILPPRVRPAPDGPTSAGRPPAAIRVSTRRV